MKELELDINLPHPETPATKSNGEGAIVVAADAPDSNAVAPPPRRPSTSQNSSEQTDDEDEATATKSIFQKNSLLREYLKYEDSPFSLKMLKEIIGGIGLASFIRHNWGFLAILVSLIIFYIALGYETDREIVENNRLTEELEDRKYKALIRESELCEHTLRSKVEKMLKDSTLHTPTQSSYHLPVEEDDELFSEK